jgi:hypothetical protein
MVTEGIEVFGITGEGVAAVLAEAIGGSHQNQPALEDVS